MELSILAIDSNIENYNKLKPQWDSRGILFYRENSMREAMARLKKENFFFICINGDNINFWPQLELLREIAQCPIFILNTTVTTKDLLAAYQIGADMYWYWRDEDVCAQVGISIAQRYHEKGTQNRKPPKISTYGELTVIPAYRQVLGNDQEIPLAKTEFDILNYLITNRGTVLSYQQIYRHIGCGEYDETSPGGLFSIMKRLRKKIREEALLHEYIVNVRGVGYKFPAIFINKD